MTTAIEQAKREMYGVLSNLGHLTGLAENGVLKRGQSATSEFQLFQCKLEEYFEQLRQQYEEMASTAHQRFESIQSLESVNQDLIVQLAKMAESRDMFRNLHQAATHASIERVGKASASGQDSGDRASCEQPDGKTMAILGVVVDCQQIVSDWAVYGYRAKKQMKKLAYVLNNNPELSAAMKSFETPSCMHSFFAIGQDQMKCTFCGVGK